MSICSGSGHSIPTHRKSPQQDRPPSLSEEAQLIWRELQSTALDQELQVTLPSMARPAFGKEAGQAPTEISGSGLAGCLSLTELFYSSPGTELLCKKNETR